MTECCSSFESWSKLYERVGMMLHFNPTFQKCDLFVNSMHHPNETVGFNCGDAAFRAVAVAGFAHYFILCFILLEVEEASPRWSCFCPSSS